MQRNIFKDCNFTFLINKNKMFDKNKTKKIKARTLSTIMCLCKKP